MLHLKTALFVLYTIAGITGLRAAVLWLKASKVPVEPIGGDTADEPLNQQGWTAGIGTSVSKSGEINALAARWTAASVLVSAAA